MTTESEADMVAGVNSSISYLKSNDKIRGWVPSGDNEDAESLFYLVYESIDVRGAFHHSKTHPGTWDADYSATRSIRAVASHGLEKISIDFTRETDKLLPFGPDRKPNLHVESFVRPNDGFVFLEKPRKDSGASFVQDLVFSPRLTQHELVTFSVRGHLPSYKFGNGRDLTEATQISRHGPRSHDWALRVIAYPTKHLRSEVFIPDDLNATPRGLSIGRGPSETDPSLEQQALANGRYSCTKVTRNGVTGFLVVLDVPNPRLRCAYRLVWQLP